MKLHLLPTKFKKIGWCLLIPATILGVFRIISDFDNDMLTMKVFAILNDNFMGSTGYFKVIETDVTNTIVGVLFILGALFVGFAKEKSEDEFIAKLRLSSLLWAVLVNYTLLLLAFIFIYGIAFLNVMIYNMFTVLIIFIGRFHYILHFNNKFVSNEK
ncbi:MAG: hypothetical protein ABIV51_03920 [Saprospiraceae bacterium]